MGGALTESNLKTEDLMKKWIKLSFVILVIGLVFAAADASATQYQGRGNGYGRNQIRDFNFSVSDGQVFGGGYTRSGQSFSLTGDVGRNGKVSGTISVDGEEVGTFDGIVRSHGFTGRYRVPSKRVSGLLLGRRYVSRSPSFPG